MPQIPQFIADAGETAIVVFLFVAAVWLIFRIVQAVRNGRRSDGVRCYQQPIISTIQSNQAVIVEAVKKVEESGEELKQNLILQTALMERMVALQEKMSDYMVRQDERDKTKAWSRAPGGASK